MWKYQHQEVDSDTVQERHLRQCKGTKFETFTTVKQYLDLVRGKWWKLSKDDQNPAVCEQQLRRKQTNGLEENWTQLRRDLDRKCFQILSAWSQIFAKRYILQKFWKPLSSFVTEYPEKCLGSDTVQNWKDCFRNNKPRCIRLSAYVICWVSEIPIPESRAQAGGGGLKWPAPSLFFQKPPMQLPQQRSNNIGRRTSQLVDAVCCVDGADHQNRIEVSIKKKDDETNIKLFHSRINLLQKKVICAICTTTSLPKYPFAFFILHSTFLLTDYKNLQQDHLTQAISNAIAFASSRGLSLGCAKLVCFWSMPDGSRARKCSSENRNARWKTHNWRNNAANS